MDVQIIGIDRSQQENGRAFYVPLRWLQQATGWGDATNMLWLSMTHADDGAIDRSTNAVEDALTTAGYRVAPQTLHSLKAENKAANDAILNMIILVGGVVVAIGMVGLVNAITMNVIERTREIGILRCLRARTRHPPCICGGERRAGRARVDPRHAARIPAVVGSRAADVDDHGTRDRHRVRRRTALIVLAATIVLAALIVVGPVRRATRINTGDALRYV